MNASSCIGYINSLTTYGEVNYVKALKPFDKPYMEAVIDAKLCVKRISDVLDEEDHMDHHTYAAPTLRKWKSVLNRFKKIETMVHMRINREREKGLKNAFNLLKNAKPDQSGFIKYAIQQHLPKAPTTKVKRARGGALACKHEAT